MLCDPCQRLYDGWLDYTPPDHMNRYVQTWKEAAGGYADIRSREMQDANRRRRRELVTRQLDNITRNCKEKHA